MTIPEKKVIVVAALLGVMPIVGPQPSMASQFLRFFSNQKVGQEITVTGGHRHFPSREKRRYFIHKVGEGAGEYVEYYGMTIVPTFLAGNGSISITPSLWDKMLILYVAKDMVKRIPEKGDSLWFTGTLIGYQYGTMGITKIMNTGGQPYLLLDRVSANPPAGGTGAEAKTKE